MSHLRRPNKNRWCGNYGRKLTLQSLLGPICMATLRCTHLTDCFWGEDSRGSSFGAARSMPVCSSVLLAPRAHAPRRPRASVYNYIGGHRRKKQMRLEITTLPWFLQLPDQSTHMPACGRAGGLFGGGLRSSALLLDSTGLEASARKMRALVQTEAFFKLCTALAHSSLPTGQLASVCFNVRPRTQAPACCPA